jgi:hypothetical protein
MSLCILLPDNLVQTSSAQELFLQKAEDLFCLKVVSAKGGRSLLLKSCFCKRQQTSSAQELFLQKAADLFCSGVVSAKGSRPLLLKSCFCKRRQTSSA